ncbi:ABC transporter permease [Ramlibacter sp. AW1]|uniref:ABC transporter permease n=1 Tax=Ramlibacter aurantiacus TaxID=2801330 RepID=A0A937D747_9BURK|nr:ABC transporter permease [Ramlibacter aurantiacus]MBL0421628.1 ABC transporter permease [Ramlibacter aurantiacus]
MSLSEWLALLINGLASASTLFLLAAGLSLIFGVTRIVNFAHGSFYMLGLYTAYTMAERLGSTVLGFWGAVLVAAVAVGVLGALVEMLLLRRLYKVPELFQLLATFALVLVLRDAALWLWGSEDLLGPRAPGLSGSVELFGSKLPSYDLLLIFVGPAMLLALTLLMSRTRFGRLIRASTQDREMVGALGVNQKVLFTAVFALGSFLAGLGGAMQLPREPASLFLDLQALGDAFVVVVVGGMGSIPGAFLAAIIIAGAKAVCTGLGTMSIAGIDVNFSKLTLVVEFLIMAAVLVVRPWGLLGRPAASSRQSSAGETPLERANTSFKVTTALVAVALIAIATLGQQMPYAPVLMTDILIAALFVVSLHFIAGPGGLHTFGHAAYFGIGAYGAAFLLKSAGLPMEASLLLGPVFAGLAAVVFGWFSVRLSGVYFAMLTLAFAQIVWSVVFQWEDVTGGSNGMTGIWPSDWLADKTHYYLLTLVIAAFAAWLLRKMLFSPFGYALRAARDSVLRSEAIGIDTKAVQWTAFILSGLVCGYAGALFAFSKGSISPETISVGRSFDGIVMIMLGGINTIAGPVVGAAVFTWLQDLAARTFEYWRAAIGITILLLVLLFPEGIIGTLKRFFAERERRPAAAPPPSPPIVPARTDAALPPNGAAAS